MENNDTQVPPYYHTSTTISSATPTAVPTPSNGLSSGDGTHMLYPHVSPPVDTAKKKRGRPRKYGTPEQARAAREAASFALKEKREREHSQQHYQQHHHQEEVPPGFGNTSSYLKKIHFGGVGDAGHGFSPHILTVAPGEDVAQKIMLFVQQCKRELCVLSACGTVSNASLRQPATSGGSIMYEGCFEIISLSGSYVRTDIGERTGGLSVCLSNSDGQIVGGGVGGPLRAGGPVQVIVGTFLVGTKKESGKLQSPFGGTTLSSVGFHSTIDFSGGGRFMVHQGGQIR